MGQVENKSENGRFKSNYINNSLNIGQQTPHQKKKKQAWENTYCIFHLYKVTEEGKLRKRVTDCLGPRV